MILSLWFSGWEGRSKTRRWAYVKFSQHTSIERIFPILRNIFIK